MIWASFMVLIRRSTGREGVGAAVVDVDVGPAPSEGLARDGAGDAFITAGAVALVSGVFAAVAACKRGGGGALRSAAS